jgi:hypothetical protein
LQTARPPRDRRLSRKATSTDTVTASNVKKIRRREKQTSISSSMTTTNHRLSKHGLYVVSSRRLDFFDNVETTTGTGSALSEQFCLQKVQVCVIETLFLIYFIIDLIFFVSRTLNGCLNTFFILP